MDTSTTSNSNTDIYASWSREDLIRELVELRQSSTTLTTTTTTHTTTPSTHLNEQSTTPTDKKLLKSLKKQHQIHQLNQQIINQETSTNNTNTTRPFDITQHTHRPIALKIAYFGWSYAGLASQDTHQLNHTKTIEYALFKALTTAKLIKDPRSCGYSRCGRTDKGVSALCQVLGLWVRSKLPVGRAKYVRMYKDVETVIDDEEGGITNSNITNSNNGNGEEEEEEDPEEESYPEDTDNDSLELDYPYILNRLLPPEIRVLSWSPISPSFSARFACYHRTYQYTFPSHALNIPAMQTAANYLVGLHDFRNFCKLDATKETASYHRSIDLVKIEPVVSVFGQTGDSSSNTTTTSIPYHILTLRGSAFLWHQVRCIMHILFLIGTNREKPELVRDLLDLSKHVKLDPETNTLEPLGKPSYDLADDIPLALVECGYEPLESLQVPITKYRRRNNPFIISWKSSEMNTARVIEDVYLLWKQHATRMLQVGRLLSNISGVEDGGLCKALEERIPSHYFHFVNRYTEVMERPRGDSIEVRRMKLAEKLARKKGKKVEKEKEQTPPMKKIRIVEEEEMEM